jgi:hypothetical protein
MNSFTYIKDAAGHEIYVNPAQINYIKVEEATSTDFWHGKYDHVLTLFFAGIYGASLARLFFETSDDRNAVISRVVTR